MISMAGLMISSFKAKIVYSSLDRYRLINLQHHL